MPDPLNIHLLVGATSTPGPVGDGGAIDNEALVSKWLGVDEMWEPHTNGITQDLVPYGQAIDSHGCIVTVGGMRFGGPNRQYGVVKISSSGEHLWSKQIGAIDSTNDNAFGVAIDGADNIYVVGQSKSGDAYYGVLVKLDMLGNEVWQKAFADPDASPTNFTLTDIVLVGGALYISACQYNAAAHLMKVGLDGSIIWTKSFEDLAYTRSFFPSSIAADSAGNIYMLSTDGGYSEDGTAALLTKWDSSGNIVWHRAVDPDPNAGGYYGTMRVAVTTDDCPVFVLGDYNDALQIIKYDAAGNQLWAKKARPEGTGTYGDWYYDLAQPTLGVGPGGDIYIACHYTAWSTATTGVFCFQSDGSLRWQREMFCGMNDFPDYPYFSPISVFNGFMHFSVGPIGDGLNRYEANRFCKLPLNPTYEMNFGGVVGFTSITDPLYQLQVSTSLTTEVANVATAWNLTNTNKSIVPSLNRTLEVTDLSANPKPADVLRLSPEITFTNDAWGGVFTDHVEAAGPLSPFFSQVVTDNAGNIIVSGYCNVPSTTSAQDFLLCKFSPTGATIWRKGFSGIGSIDTQRICVDSSDNIYLTGNSGSTGVVVWKFDSSGNSIWSQQIGSGNNWNFGAIKVKGSSVFIVGNFYNGTQNDGYLFKISTANGSIQMQRKYTWTNQVIMNTLMILDNDDMIITGDILSAAVATEKYENFVLKVDSTGNILAQRFLGTVSSHFQYFDDSVQSYRDAAGNLYFVGQCNAGPNGANYQYDYKLSITKYNSSLVHQWTRQYYGYGGWNSVPCTGTEVITELAFFGVSYVANWISSATGPTRNLLMKFDLNGNMTFCQVVHSGGENIVSMNYWNYGGSCFDGSHLYYVGELYGDAGEAGGIVKVPKDGVANGVYGKWQAYPFNLQEGTSQITVYERAGTLVKGTDPVLTSDARTGIVPADITTGTLHVTPMK